MMALNTYPLLTVDLEISFFSKLFLVKPISQETKEIQVYTLIILFIKTNDRSSHVPCA